MARAFPCNFRAHQVRLVPIQVWPQPTNVPCAQWGTTALAAKLQSMVLVRLAIIVLRLRNPAFNFLVPVEHLQPSQTSQTQRNARTALLEAIAHLGTLLLFIFPFLI